MRYWFEEIVRSFSPNKKPALGRLLGEKMTKTEVLAAIKRLETTLHSFGYPNDSALQKVDSIVFQLETNDLSGPFQDKLHSFKIWAHKGISTKKFAPWGAETVRSFALEDCENMRMILDGLNLPD